MSRASLSSTGEELHRHCSSVSSTSFPLLDTTRLSFPAGAPACVHRRWSRSGACAAHILYTCLMITGQKREDHLQILPPALLSPT